MVAFRGLILSLMLIVGTTNLFAGNDDDIEGLDFRFSKLIINKKKSLQDILDKYKNDKKFVAWVESLNIEEKAKEFEKCLKKQDTKGAKKVLQSFSDDLTSYMKSLTKKDLQSLKALAKEVSCRFRDGKEVKEASCLLAKQMLLMKECKALIPNTKIPQMAFNPIHNLTMTAALLALVLLVGGVCYFGMLGVLSLLTLSGMVIDDTLRSQMIAHGIVMATALLTLCCSGLVSGSFCGCHLIKHKKLVRAQLTECLLTGYIDNFWENELSETKKELWKWSDDIGDSDKSSSLSIDVDLSE